MITISVWLHGKPNWALPLEGKDIINPYYLKNYGDELRNHLYDVSKIVYKLQINGWRLLKSFGSLYNLDYVKEDISKEEVICELKNIGVNINKVAIEEISTTNL